MINLSIDGKPVHVADGSTLLQAAQQLGIEIPTLCYLKDMKPSTSCMVCVVKVEGRKTLLPACGTEAQEGMVVFSDNDEVHVARRTALELLLSDHVGDCMGPCQVACPAHMDIPLMIRQIAQGQWEEAIQTVKADIALPAVLGRICPAPCEKTCRREQVDKAVGICLLKRFVADLDLECGSAYQPKPAADTGKRVAIVGAGPAGLAAAYYLQQAGFACTVYDDRAEAGGQLRYGVPQEECPPEVLMKEIEQIQKLGVTFQQATRVGRDITLVQLREEYGAVFLGVGASTPEDLGALGFDPDKDRIKVTPQTYQTEIPGVFAGGDVCRRRKVAIRSLADGKEAAVAIAQFLGGITVTGVERPFNSRMGKLESAELDQLAGPVSSANRVVPEQEGMGFTEEQARNEAERCLHCDCRKPTDCKLRIYAQAYGAKGTIYRGTRRPYVWRGEHPEIIFEFGKCINCGICVHLTEQHREELGLTFIGRGFDVQVTVPFDRSIKEGLSRTAKEVVEACPTGALVFK